MAICPSILCKKENPVGSNYCIHCGIDMTMDKEEITGRDIFYELVVEFAKMKNNPEYNFVLDMKRSEFDSMMQRNAGRIFLMLAKTIAKEEKTSDEKKAERVKQNIEEEKLKVLKEINKNLKEMTKRRNLQQKAKYRKG